MKVERSSAVKRIGFLLVLILCGAWTIHRSFTHREVGFGSSASVSVPVDKRVSDAIDAGREQQAEKTLSIFGRVTRVSDGDTIWVTPNGGTRTKVRLDRIDAPESDQPFGKKSTAYLKRLIGGRDVEVRYTKRDRYGRVLGIVWMKDEEAKDEGMTDVNLKMVREGMAWHYSYFDKTPDYIEAQREARDAGRGLWADAKPINPYEWRKRRR